MDYEEFDDLDEILSNFPTESTSKNDSEDSADELLDLLMDEEKLSPVKKKHKSDENKENIEESEESEEDEAQIAALEAQLAKLKSKKKKRKSEESAEKVNKKSTPSAEKVNQKTIPPAVSSKDKSPASKDTTVLDENQEKKVKKASPPKTQDNLNQDLDESSQPKEKGFYSKKKERVARAPRKEPSNVKDPKISTNKQLKQDVKKSSIPDVKKGKSSSSSYNFLDIEIRQPLISSIVLDERMKGRRLVKISRIEKTMKDNDIEGDWVTVGVLVSKVPQKTTSTGKNFSVWKLSDLGMGTENNLVGFFLFGEVNKEHWKTQTGAVVALLNPTIMKKNKDDHGVAINIDNPKKLMEIGVSKDLGTCKGVRRSDNKSCTMFINTKYGDYCEYHVTKAFKKAKAGRMELQGGGKVPKDKRKGNRMDGLMKNIQCGEVHYGGRTVTLQAEPKNQVKLKKVTAPVKKETGLRSVMSKDVKALADRDFQETKIKREKEKLQLLGGTEEFKELLAVPTIGARNLHKLLDGNRIKEEEIVAPQPKCFQARSFLKSNKGELLQSATDNKDTEQSKKRKLCDVNFFDDTMTTKDNAKKSQPAPPPPPKKEKINMKALAQKKNFTPMLGRGLQRSEKLEFQEDFLCYDKYTGEDTNGVNELRHGDEKALTDTLSRNADKRKKTVGLSKAKKNAISLVMEIGGIEADNQNEVTAKRKTSSTSEKIKKRVESSLDEIKGTEDANGDAAGEKEEQKPKRKKGILDGLFKDNIDLKSEEGKKLMKTTSKNVGAVKMAEAEREEKYFNSMEKKEAMEEKMLSVTEIKVTLYACRECNYKAESLSKLCKAEQHPHSILKNQSKLFFACRSCKTRCVAYSRLLPKNPCTKCGEMNFEKTSMATARKGPTLETEKLELRGREQKFINS